RPPMQKEFPRPVWPYQWAPFIATVSSLTVVGMPITFFLMLPLGMSSDPCGSNDTRYYICTDSGQQLVVELPWIGLVAAVILSFVGAIVARLFRRSLFWALPLAALAYLVPTGIAIAIGAAPSSTPW
ncbi:MAG TPA: hypothetical protein VG317_00660, partial [Pseudonocardiaceae bacterium]|nr:hypothetical protein [Pseudonocardiaceae bacterium]